MICQLLIEISSRRTCLLIDVVGFVAEKTSLVINITHSHSGTLKIADFGLADCYRESPAEPDRRLSRICGSYEYLSPQVLENDYR